MAIRTRATTLDDFPNVAAFGSALLFQKEFANDPRMRRSPEVSSAPGSNSVKIARIFDQDAETFALEYDNSVGKKNMMRLEATTYEGAIREAKAFLGIDEENIDGDGTEWDVG